MKKIFISFLALIAMVGAINAQRVWAYDLNLEQMESDPVVCKFLFTATADATGANLVFLNADGTEAGKVAVENVVKGVNVVELSIDKIPGQGTLNWAVELSGAAITKVTEVTNDTTDAFRYYLPQDVKVDNNPESDYFGYVYVAAATDGASDGGSERATNQKRGIFVYNQLLQEMNPESNVGILPANAAALMTDVSRQAIHRMAINPINNHVAYAYNVEGASAVWSMDPANLAGDAVNLIEGLTITKANAICFDEEGVLYVMDNANTSTGGAIVKVVDGALDTVAQSAIWGVQDLSLVSDGRGGFWLAQHRWAVDAYAVLSHVNADGVVDFSVTGDSSADIKAMFPNSSNASYRGQCAYNVNEGILAFGGDKVVSLFQVTYAAETGIPSIEKLYTTPAMGTNIDGVAFDHAGDLYVVCASSERFYKYAVPTDNNTCTTPAPKAQVITKTGVETSLENTVVSTQAKKIVRDGQVMIIRDGKTYNMLGLIVE